jgi:hypothetical protein
MGKTGAGLVLAVLVVAALGAGYLAVSSGRQASTATETLSSTTVATPTVKSPTLVVNGSTYRDDNVTKIMNTQGMTFHFDNGSVTFLGVEFQTVCTDYASGCPGVPPPPANTTVTLATGAGITLNVTFPDDSSEVIGGGFPLVPVYFHAFSQHTDPQAGILVVYTDSSPGYKSYLLVSTSSTSGGAGISSNTVVATVTVTTTLTAQASQATTSYVLPSGCSYYPLTTTVTSTATVGSGVPVSTSTTTVTTTSTSYSQTVTGTSCTHGSNPTVTSTVTTTTSNP